MRHFEFNDGKSNKFWNIELVDTSFTVTYGRAGTAGQTQTKEFATADKARAAHDKLIAEKTSKGYVEKSAGPSAAAAPTSGKALENAILANPDDLGAHAAFADWLIEQGDPRGEFIQVQLALEDPQQSPKERKGLEKREQQLLKKHHQDWLGDLAHFFKVEDRRCQWARGWLNSIASSEFSVELSRALARAPLARCLRRLEIRNTTYEEAGDYPEGDDVPEYCDEPALYPLRGSRCLTHLRVFQLGDLQYAHCNLEGEVAVELVKQMPHLEELYLMAHGVEADVLFRLKSLTHLRVLRLDHLYDYPFHLLAKNPAFANLTTLHCHPHAIRPGDESAYITLPDVKALLRSPHLKKLAHLQLRLTDMGDKGVQEIVASGSLERLKTLDLMGGTITDDGARRLAACPALRNLELLDLTNNRLSKAGIKALQETGIKLVAGRQRAPDDEDDDYLAEGDWE